jgi:hypothetical protein
VFVAKVRSTAGRNEELKNENLFFLFILGVLQQECKDVLFQVQYEQALWANHI